ncbi:tetratricopeptide repeat protein [Nostoc parmelioides]|uniref:Tetratricopeptide repeat protein n=1 Tax=Nostoc parmelioides FACHB-3921 TaxID=2692909 RepID=A0ABR8BNX4_9NOSO|nr:tetratricopeptide repeat protein [Nostoc parmelioides]MBD2255270.1 tetratricopeptide repeat protein [Nostoc parmelioides FACHB-3921]
MVNEDLLADAENRDAYDDLMVSIEAKAHRLNLLIAVCDDASFRDEIIGQYEAELQPEIRCYRVTLARGEPSLRSAVAQLVEREEYLEQHNPALITVTGAEQLYFLKLGKERSEQEIFFGYLQWTREGLREFPFAIVLWVTNQILGDLRKKAPDFWSWRNGVFRFVSRRKNTISGRELEPIRFAFSDNEFSSFDDDNDYLLPIEDLQRFIQDTEKRGVKDTTLATLYFTLGDIYRKRLNRGECQDYKKEQELGIEYLSKAVELQQQLDLEKELTTSLHNLAGLYDSQRKYDQAESLYLQALELRQRLLGDNHPDVAESLNNLAGLYSFQGKYDQAEPLYLQALELRQRLLGDNHPDVAESLNNLAGLYSSQGKYDQAEPLYLQALELRQRLLGDNHPDVAESLNNLAGLYSSQGKYDQAEPLYLQALELRQRLLGDNHPDVATSLHNLAGLYYYQGRYADAEPLALQTIKIDKEALGENHPNLATDIHNLALIYIAQERYSEAEELFVKALKLKQYLLTEDHPLVADTISALGSMYRMQGRYKEAEEFSIKALELDKRWLGDEHPLVATSLNNLALLYECQGKYDQAEPLFLQALELRERLLGDNHPHTVTVRKNLADLRNSLQ